MRRIFKRALPLAILFAVLLASCESPVAPIVSVSGISLQSELLLTVGKTETLSAEILPLNATDKDVSWESADPDIAEVDEDGVVTGIAEGQTTITATSDDGDKTAVCDVKVTAFRVTSITLSATNITMAKHETCTLTATILPNAATNKNVVWSSSNESVVVPIGNEPGSFFAVGAGTATITATTEDGAKTASCSVVVTP